MNRGLAFPYENNDFLQESAQELLVLPRDGLLQAVAPLRRSATPLHERPHTPPTKAA